MITMNPMPAMPRSRKSKPVHPCVCGCGMGTKSIWYPGHDGRATGWAKRIAMGLMKLEDVPANERAGAALMLKREAAKPAVKVG
jgi:hypothetical protein